MSEKTLARVPQRIWAEGRPNGVRHWESEFNMASWVRVTGGGGRLELLVRHTDEAGEHVTPVDVAEVVGHESALLSGVVRLRFQGKVDQVQVGLRLANDAMHYQVDELFMQRRDSGLGRDQKLISNF